MARTMPKVTPQDTGDIFVGSGALQYPWWHVVAIHGIDYPHNADDWSVTLSEFDEDTGKPGEPHTITHDVIMKAVRKIAGGKVKYLTPPESVTARECRALIFKGADDVDFDAASADNVLQVATFGEVIYG